MYEDRTQNYDPEVHEEYLIHDTYTCSCHEQTTNLASFSAAGPRMWNDLPPGLRRPGLSFDSFRRSLKTHLFGD